MNAVLNTLRQMFRPASRPAAPRGVPLRLESLEERCVPSMTQITPPPSGAASAIVAVVSVFPDGQTIDGTGAMVDHDHVLTSGHMIYDPAYGGWATQIAVFGGTTSSTNYVASAYAQAARVEPAFYNTMNYWNGNLGETGAGIGDIGLLTLSNPMGNAPGMGEFDLGITDNGSWTGYNFNTLGYPQPPSESFDMFQQSGPISGAVNAGHYEGGAYNYGSIFPGPSSASEFSFSLFEFGYFDFPQGNIQEEPAQTGSPLFAYSFGQPFIYGVMSNYNSSTGYAEQITGDVYNDLTSWMNADNQGTTGNPSDSVSLAQAVLQPQTTVQVSAPNNPVSYGQSVTFTAYVTIPGAPCPPTTNGVTVTFYDNGTALGTVQLKTASSTEDSASFTTSTLSVGRHSITAFYSGSAVPGGILFHSGTSGPNTGTVVKAQPTTDLVGPTGAVTAGQPATFTAYVSGTASYPTGTVTFYDGNTMLGTAQLSPYSDNLVPVASASFTTSALGVGNHSITAVYGGDGNYQGNTSGAATVQIVSQWEAPAVTDTAIGLEYAYYDYFYGTHSVDAYYAYLYAYDAAVFAQVASQTHNATQWYYASQYADAALTYAYADYAATGNAYAYDAYVYDYAGSVFAADAYTDEKI